MKELILISVFCLLIIFCFAHEYILLAAKYRLKKGDDLEIHLVVADGFNVQMERPFQKTPTKAFELLTKDGVTDLTTTENGALPIINRKVDFEGGGLIHLETDYARISLVTPKFFEYLKEDHLDSIASKVDRNKGEQKERYTRYIKCLVQSGNSFDDTIYKTVTGQRFEIILLQNPYRLHTTDIIKAKILFMGKPSKGKIITARNRSGSEPSMALTSTTDANGICSFKISRKGEWFIHATHMIPCADKSDSDWESFWTSYSFEIDK
jgi:uncharacterized GH25 family protein